MLGDFFVRIFSLYLCQLFFYRYIGWCQGFLFILLVSQFVNIQWEVRFVRYVVLGDFYRLLLRVIFGGFRLGFFMDFICGYRRKQQSVWRASGDQVMGWGGWRIWRAGLELGYSGWRFCMWCIVREIRLFGGRVERKRKRDYV